MFASGEQVMAQVSSLRFLAIVVVAVAAIAIPSQMRAQAVAVAQVSGTVSDPSGSAIISAQVTMTEVDKQQVHTTVTDPSGNYTLPNLPVGPYRLEVKTSGFKDYVQSGIELQVNNNVQINVTMQVGSIS